jgi:hypothetical protein
VGAGLGRAGESDGMAAWRVLTAFLALLAGPLVFLGLAGVLALAWLAQGRE